MAAKLQAVANSVLDWLLGTGNPTRPNAGANCQVALSTTTVDLVTGAFTEVTDTNYSRQTATFNAGAAGAADNVGELDFGPAAAPYNVVAVVIYNSAGTQIMYAGNVQGQPVPVDAGETPKFAVGALIVQEA